MNLLLLGLVWLLNFGISVWNAYAVGKWREGDWPRRAWRSLAVMPAAGFTWCYLVVIRLAASSFEGQLAELLTVGLIVLILGSLLAAFFIYLAITIGFGPAVARGSSAWDFVVLGVVLALAVGILPTDFITALVAGILTTAFIVWTTRKRQATA
jgi:hypothetical protein